MKWTWIKEGGKLKGTYYYNLKGIGIEASLGHQTVDFCVHLDKGRVGSLISFSENIPENFNQAKAMEWVEKSVGQLVQNALVQLLTSASLNLGVGHE